MDEMGQAAFETQEVSTLMNLSPPIPVHSSLVLLRGALPCQVASHLS